MNYGDWIPWNPVKETPGDYDVESYNQNFEGLVINLKKNCPKNIRLRITFSGYNGIISRIMNESYRYDLINHLSKIGEALGNNGPLFKVENSLYMRQLSEESATITDVYRSKHYYIDDSEWTFDVTSILEPKIELFIDSQLIDSYNAQQLSKT
jgi:hypothetical protein